MAGSQCHLPERGQEVTSLDQCPGGSAGLCSRRGSPCTERSAGSSPAVAAVGRAAAAFPSPRNPSLTFYHIRRQKHPRLSFFEALCSWHSTLSLFRGCQYFPPPKHLVFLGPLPKIRLPLSSSVLCFSKPLMLINNAAFLNPRARASQKERFYSSSSPFVRLFTWLRE